MVAIEEGLVYISATSEATSPASQVISGRYPLWDSAHVTLLTRRICVAVTGGPSSIVFGRLLAVSGIEQNSRRRISKSCDTHFSTASYSYIASYS